jgi:hypothetical protein
VRLASTKRSIVATIIVIAVVAAAFSVLCADGVHVPTTGAISDLCAAMTHSSAIGLGSNAGLTLLVATMLAVAIPGLATTLNTTSMRPVISHSMVAPGRSADPLNGRFRL